MNKPSIITVPNPILKQVTQKVASFDNETKKQLQLMTKTLRKEGGIGLAANQLGFHNRIFIVEFEDLVNKKNTKEHIPLTIFVNPEIVEASSDKDCLEEGCLSIPKIELEVERSKSLKIKYQNETGRKFKTAPKGLLARILQHEIDHLNGTVFTERVKEQFFAKYPGLKNLKILFFGTGEFGAIILKGLILLGFDLTIVTEKAKKAGRDRELLKSPVARIAEEFGKGFYEVHNIPNLKPQTANLDLLICSDFGQKIPASIIRKIGKAAINIHPSLLPKYRGPSPIQTAILNGEKKTGVTMIKMTDEIDAGPIIVQAQTEILDNDDYLILHDRLATLGLKLLIKTLPDISQNNLKEILQDNEAATLTRKFTKADGEIDWSKPAEQIERQIRAFYPWPGSYTFIDNKRLIIHKAHLVSPALNPQTSKLILDIVQLEGKKPIKFSEFLRGYKGQKPKWFEKIKNAKVQTHIGLH